MLTLEISYIGPGLGIATVIIILIVLLIIVVSIGNLIWNPVKSFIKRSKKLFKGGKH